MNEVRHRTSRPCSFCSKTPGDFKEHLFTTAEGVSICHGCVTTLYKHLQGERSLAFAAGENNPPLEQVVIPHQLASGFMNVSRAMALFKEAGLDVASFERECSDSASGNVIGTIPPVGTPVDPGTPVKIIVSDGRCKEQKSGIRGMFDRNTRR